MSCHSYTLEGTRHPAPPYRQTDSVTVLTRDSEPSGITCTDLSTGDYFRLARDDYELH